ncbi:hypothetical protein ACFL38_04970 [Candidatus Omnitrophota bacterium]
MEKTIYERLPKDDPLYKGWTVSKFVQTKPMKKCKRLKERKRGGCNDQEGTKGV